MRRRRSTKLADSDIPIWADPDVRRIYAMVDGQPWPRFATFNDHPDQLRLVREFIAADQNAGSNGPASAFIEACLAGIRLVDGLPASVDPGWIKFFVDQVGANNHFLWDLYRSSDEVATVAEWTVRTIERYEWGPDGNSTALGQRHSNAMELAAAAGGGTRHNPETGQFEYGDGEAARRAAAAGGFGANDSGLTRTAREDDASPSAGSTAPAEVDDFDTWSSDVATLVSQLQLRASEGEAGDNASQLFLRGMHALSEHNEADALQLFEQAARLGDVQAMFEAGSLHRSRGDDQSARFWFEAAAGADHVDGAMHAGILAFDRGDLAGAQGWYIKATQLGSVAGYGGLAQVAEVEGNERAEREWTKEGADAGDGWCMGNLAFFLLTDSQKASQSENLGLLNQALSYAERAAQLGHVNAMYSAGLASAFLSREGDALRWLQRADEAGHPNARAMMRKLGLG